MSDLEVLYDNRQVRNSQRIKCSECLWEGLVLDLYEDKCMGVCPCCRSWSGLKYLI